MNYQPNTHRWQRGKLVLHDADEKTAAMLMIVIGYTRDGLCKTQYVERSRKRTVWKNDIKYLHDPQQFGLDYDNGYPVLHSEPTRCPFCGDHRVNIGRVDDSAYVSVADAVIAQREHERDAVAGVLCDLMDENADLRKRLETAERELATRREQGAAAE